MINFISIISNKNENKLVELNGPKSLSQEPEEDRYESIAESYGFWITGNKSEIQKQVYEDDNFLLILCGYVLYDNLDYDSNLAKQLLELFRLKGTDLFKELSGAFNIIVYDKHIKKLLVSNDRLGIKALYYYKDENKLIFASDIKPIIFSNQIKKEINWSAWGDIFNYGFIIGDKTPFENVLSLPMASILTFQNGNLELQKYWTLNDVKINYGQNEKEIINKGVEILKSLTHKYERFIKEATIPLSGGYDSRCIASCLRYFSQINIETITSNLHASGLQDSIIAKELTKKMGVNNIQVSGVNFYENYFTEMVYLVNGITYEHLWAMSLKNNLPNGTVLFDGLAGDLFLKGIRSVRLYNADKDNYKNEELANLFIQSKKIASCKLPAFFKDDIQIKMTINHIDFINQIRNINENKYKITLLYLNSQNRNSSSVGSYYITGKNGRVLFFFINNDLIDYSLAMPPRYKYKRSIYQKILSQAFHEIMLIPSTNDHSIIYSIKKKILDILQTLTKNTMMVKTFHLLGINQKKINLIHDISALPLNQNDENYLMDLIKKLDYPSELNKELLIKKINNMVLSGEKIDNIIIPIANFLVWYNLFYLEKSPNELKSIGSN